MHKPIVRRIIAAAFTVAALGGVAGTTAVAVAGTSAGSVAWDGVKAGPAFFVHSSSPVKDPNFFVHS